MKKLGLIALFSMIFSVGFSQETPQNLIENEKYLAMSPYESYLLTCTELLNFYNSMDASTLAALGATEREAVNCQKNCLEANIKICKKYQTLDPTYTIQQMTAGIESAFIQGWSEEIAACLCE